MLSRPIPCRATVHDRSIVVHLTPEAVVVEYHLDVDREEWTLFKDLAAVKDELDDADFKKPSLRREAFLRVYAPRLAKNFTARLGKEELNFTCIKTSHLSDFDHIRLSFVFRAPWRPTMQTPAQFSFREGNYEYGDGGRVTVTLVADEFVSISDKKEADEALKKRPLTELKPGDNDRLRSTAATFVIDLEELPLPKEIADKPATQTIPAAPPPTAKPTEPAAEHAEPRRLIDLLFSTHLGLSTLLALATAFGAVHALTPGHGKTLVAAYLVGERGTVWHAILLGLVTTLTHTGAVLILAAVLFVWYPDTVPAHVQTALGFGGGLLIAGLGIWLLLRRLAGGPDHFHIGGGHHHHHHGDGHHHHHHGDADHYHDERGHTHPLPKEAVGVWGLILVGIQGGIVPCWDAIAMFGFAVAAQRVALGLPLLLAFSAGLAGVLVLIGVLVVKAKGFAGSHFGESRFFKVLPLVSAVLVTILGMWLCYDSLHPEAPAPVGGQRAAINARGQFRSFHDGCRHEQSGAFVDLQVGNLEGDWSARPASRGAEDRRHVA